MLENALSHKLIPAKRDIVGASTQTDARALAGDGARRCSPRATPASTSSSPSSRALRGKNTDVVEHMMARVREEKELFERGLARYTALRNVFTQQTTQLFDVIGLESLRAQRPAARASASRAARSPRACATRWATSSRARGATSRKRAARPPRSTR